MIIVRNILAFITDPKNTRMLLLGFIVVLCMLLLRQCQQTEAARTVIQEKIVEVPVTVKDTIIGNFDSALSFTSKNEWGNSFREIGVTVPYTFSVDSTLFGDATIDLKQNIWLTASLIRDKKTKELFVNLETDYPGTTFNSAKGIMIDQSSSAFKDLQLQNRKTFGLGIHLGYGLGTNGASPYVGFGVHYSPKFLQW